MRADGPQCAVCLSLCSHAGGWYCLILSDVFAEENYLENVYSVLVLVLRWKLQLYICKRTGAQLQNKIGLPTLLGLYKTGLGFHL